MAINNMNELFEHELMDIYGAEQQVLKMLQQMTDEAQTPQLKEAVTNHVDETRNQIGRIERVFQSMNIDKRDVSCPTVEGLSQEKRNLKQQNPSKELLDVVNIGSTIKTEHYEIAAYENLLTMAKQLGMEDVVAPLKENLEEERAMLERVQRASKEMKIGQQQKQTQQR